LNKIKNSPNLESEEVISIRLRKVNLIYILNLRDVVYQTLIVVGAASVFIIVNDVINHDNTLTHLYVLTAKAGLYKAKKDRLSVINSSNNVHSYSFVFRKNETENKQNQNT
jgi:hypothetical protein